MSGQTDAIGVSFGGAGRRFGLVANADGRMINEKLPEHSTRSWCSSDHSACSRERRARPLRPGIGQIESQADWR